MNRLRVIPCADSSSDEEPALIHSRTSTTRVVPCADSSSDDDVPSVAHFSSPNFFVCSTVQPCFDFPIDNEVEKVVVPSSAPSTVFPVFHNSHTFLPSKSPLIHLHDRSDGFSPRPKLDFSYVISASELGKFLKLFPCSSTFSRTELLNLELVLVHSDFCLPNHCQSINLSFLCFLPREFVPCTKQLSDCLEEIRSTIITDAIISNLDTPYVYKIQCFFDNSPRSIQNLQHLELVLQSRQIPARGLEFFFYKWEWGVDAFVPTLLYSLEDSDIRSLKQKICNQFQNFIVIFKDKPNVLHCSFFPSSMEGCSSIESRIQKYSFSLKNHTIHLIPATCVNPNSFFTYCLLYHPLSIATQQLADAVQTIVGSENYVLLICGTIYIVSSKDNLEVTFDGHFTNGGVQLYMLTVFQCDSTCVFPLLYSNHNLSLTCLRRVYPQFSALGRSLLLQNYFKHLQVFRTKEKIRGVAYNSLQLLNLAVQATTISSIISRSFQTPLGNNRILKCQGITVSMYSFIDLFNKVNAVPISKTAPGLQIVQQDCLDVAQRFKGNTAVLCMGNDNVPGGGYKIGAFGQQESILRRTTLLAALDPLSLSMSPVDGRKVPSHPWDFDVLLAENVEVFRHSQDLGYRFFENDAFQLSIITTAAPDTPQLTRDQDDFNSDDHRQLVLRRWNCVFLSAIKHKIQHLVLSPLGCGSFHNPLPAVCMIMVLMEYCYSKFFKSLTLTDIGENFSMCKSIITSYKAGLKTMLNPVTTLRVCPKWSACDNLGDSLHKRSYCHPPVCRGRNCPPTVSHCLFACHDSLIGTTDIKGNAFLPNWKWRDDEKWISFSYSTSQLLELRWSMFQAGLASDTFILRKIKRVADGSFQNYLISYSSMVQSNSDTSHQRQIKRKTVDFAPTLSQSYPLVVANQRSMHPIFFGNERLARLFSGAPVTITKVSRDDLFEYLVYVLVHQCDCSIYGGYVRDFLIRNAETGDLDVCCPSQDLNCSIDQFVDKLTRSSYMFDVDDPLMVNNVCQRLTVVLGRVSAQIDFTAPGASRKFSGAAPPFVEADVSNLQVSKASYLSFREPEASKNTDLATVITHCMNQEFVFYYDLNQAPQMKYRLERRVKKGWVCLSAIPSSFRDVFNGCNELYCPS
ncbi:hypothetical protein RCL1_005723 [Eukaryota sp. TZLM3-RCL]